MRIEEHLDVNFRDLDIQGEYRSLHDDVVKQFYLPVLTHSVLYQRAVGFFSSSALVNLTDGIRGLIENGGTIEVVASPRLSEDDILAINDGIKRKDEVVRDALLRELNDPKGKFEEVRLNLLSNLIAASILTIKIATLDSNNGIGMFHEKLGLMHDGAGNVIAFSGSMNESSNAFYQNYEAIDVFRSWTSDIERVDKKESTFRAMWNDYEPGISVSDFPDISEHLIDRYKISDGIDLSALDAEPNQRISTAHDEGDDCDEAGPRIPSWVKMREYQNEAISNWAASGYRGIFDMATGAGKTFTALAAIVNLSNNVGGKLAVIIVCPYQHLVEQWREDIVNFGMNPIVCYSASKQKNWRERVKSQIDGFSMGVSDGFCIVTTNATFATDFMQEQVARMSGNCLIVVDEAHNFGATRQIETLPHQFPFRLALSATIERFGDESGTRKLFEYFGEKCIEYTLADAIKNRMLTPYYYHPICVSLNGQELEEYLDLSQKIRKAIGSSDKRGGHADLSDYAKMLLIKRARIVAAASSKLGALIEAIQPYREDNHILVYCGATSVNDPDYTEGVADEGDARQIDVVVKLLQQQGMKVAKFTSEENTEKRAILKERFAEGKQHQALVAIRCLDEGVNIPDIRTAFILASGVNPKEYVQRRGRVLRKAKGKQYAEIFDFITLPVPLDKVDEVDEGVIELSKSLAVRELVRMKDFADLALNPLEADSLTWDIINRFNISVEDERSLDYE